MFLSIIYYNTMIQRSVYKFDHKCIIESLLSSSDKLSLIIPQIIAVLIILFLILPLHELAHGWVAYKFGDRTAKMQED